MDAIGANRKQLHEGKEYDYVFDVDIREGMPPLKLALNAEGTISICRIFCAFLIFYPR